MNVVIMKDLADNRVESNIKKLVYENSDKLKDLLSRITHYLTIDHTEVRMWKPNFGYNLMGFKKTNQKRAFYEMLKIFCVQTLFCYIGIGRVYIILSETIGLSLDHKTQMFVQRMTLSRCHTNIKMYMLMVP